MSEQNCAELQVALEDERRESVQLAAERANSRVAQLGEEGAHAHEPQRRHPLHGRRPEAPGDRRRRSTHICL